jgi:hypothetical protein
MERQMDLASSQARMKNAAGVLGQVRGKGARLWSQNGQLHYAAPKGALTQHDIAALRSSKDEIVVLLERADVAAVRGQGPVPRQRVGPAPLAFSQLTHWNSNRLAERPTIRLIASATRVQGRLHLDALQDSIAEIIRQQEMLRARIVIRDGIPMQEVAHSSDYGLRVDRLQAGSDTSRECQLKESIARLITQPTDAGIGPLWDMRLLELGEDEHLLIIAMEHTVADMYSMSILLRDLFTAYGQATRGDVISLPPVSVQFPDHAGWQAGEHRPVVERHAAYWNERSAGCARLRFPSDPGSSRRSSAGMHTVPVRISANLRVRLHEWCRLRGTTPAMCICTAYVALVLRWCRTSECLVRYQSDGRISPDVENTIGFFASPLYLYIRLANSERFEDLLDRVTEEYCHGYERADLSYATAQIPRPEFTRSALFNWIPLGPKADRADISSHGSAIVHSPVSFELPVEKGLDVDIDPAILLMDVGREIIGNIYFPLSRFCLQSMQAFARNFMAFVSMMLEEPEMHINSIRVRD